MITFCNNNSLDNHNCDRLILHRQLQEIINKIKETPQSYLILVNGIFELIERSKIGRNRLVYIDIFKASMTFETSRLIYYTSVSEVYKFITPNSVEKIKINSSCATHDREFEHVKQCLFI